MNRPLALASLLVLATAALAVVPPAHAAHCDVTAPTTVATDPVTVTVPLPASVGPVTVGGQTVGPYTVPPILTLDGVPVVGTVTVGGQTVGPETLPQETVGPVPTGLQPLSATVHGQSATVPFSSSCTLQTAGEVVIAAVACVRDMVEIGWCDTSRA